MGGRVVTNTTRIIYKSCIFLRVKSKQHVSAVYGHHQVLCQLRFHYINCVNCIMMWRSPHRIIVEIYPCNIYSEIVIDIKPDDGHIRPKHVVLIQLLRIYIFYISYELCFWLPSHLSRTFVIVRGFSNFDAANTLVRANRAGLLQRLSRAYVVSCNKHPLCSWQCLQIKTGNARL